MELMREVVEAHPQSARALLIVANLELASGRREAVRHWLERARVLAPESPEVKALAAHLAAGAVPSSPATTR